MNNERTIHRIVCEYSQSDRKSPFGPEFEHYMRENGCHPVDIQHVALAQIFPTMRYLKQLFPNSPERWGSVNRVMWFMSYEDAQKFDFYCLP